MRALSWPNSGRWGTLVVLAVLLVTLAIACSSDPEGDTDLLRDPAPEIGADEVLLYVSNQSYEDPDIHVIVTIDGEVVVDDQFSVGNQHYWVPHLFDLSPGEHRLRAESSTGATFDGTFETLPGQPRWAVLNYWNESGEEGRRFVLTSYDEPVRFY